jgi:hypothetical protein
VETLTAEWQVVGRLEQLGLTRAGVMEVVRQCAAAHAACTDNDPPGARGYEVWRIGIRSFREVFGGKNGWEKNESAGFSTITNQNLKLRVAVTNADEITGVIRGDLAPQNRLPKGSTAERAVTTNQIIDQMSLALVGGLMRTLDSSVTDGYQTWHFCVHIKGGDVRAELSRFNGYKDGFLSDCRERIFIVGDGDWTAPNISGADDSGPEFEFEIRRKQ